MFVKEATQGVNIGRTSEIESVRYLVGGRKGVKDGQAAA